MALSKDDIDAIRKADDLVVHLGTGNDNFCKGMVRLIKRKPFRPKPFETDTEYVLENVKVGMETAEGNRALGEGKAKCFAMIGIYPNQRTPAWSILSTLKVGDEVTFSFWPDAHSNKYVDDADLHADALYMHVTRKGKRQSWELDISICPNNSARMCQGVQRKVISYA